MNLDIIDPGKAVITEINDYIPEKRGIRLFVKRLDAIHPAVGGNKWFKLKYNLIDAHKKKFKTLLTFGGAYSNHIYATSAAGKLFGFDTIGIIRGEEHKPLNPTLRFAVENGMKLKYIDRVTYRKKKDVEFISSLEDEFGNVYIIPEGGTNFRAVRGCAEIIDSIDISFDFVCTASGTGGTLAGLVSGLRGQSKAVGFSVLKGGGFLKGDVENLLIFSGMENPGNWEINTDYHFGGYAKISRELLTFIRQFEERTGIKTEPVYTGKMFFGIYDLIEKGYFPAGSKIIALHTGGIQGLAGMTNRITKLLGDK